MSKLIGMTALMLTLSFWACARFQIDSSSASDGRNSADAVPNSEADPTLEACTCVFTTAAETFTRSIFASPSSKCETADILKSQAELGKDGQPTGKYLIAKSVTGDVPSFESADASCEK